MIESIIDFESCSRTSSERAVLVDFNFDFYQRGTTFVDLNLDFND
jgi:hypothetical protein